jgi:hypothetical protein
MNGSYAFSPTSFSGTLGSTVHVRFPVDGVASIFMSSSPPCSKGGSSVEHLITDAVDIEGVRTFVVIISENTVLYFFVQSQYHDSCSPVCCLTFIPDPINSGNPGFSSHTVTSTATGVSPVRDRPLASGSAPASNYLIKPSASASSVLPYVSSGPSNNTEHTILPPITNRAISSVSISILTWLGTLGILALILCC